MFYIVLRSAFIYDGPQTSIVVDEIPLIKANHKGFSAMMLCNEHYLMKTYSYTFKPEYSICVEWGSIIIKLHVIIWKGFKYILYKNSTKPRIIIVYIQSNICKKKTNSLFIRIRLRNGNISNAF